MELTNHLMRLQGVNPTDTKQFTAQVYAIYDNRGFPCGKAVSSKTITLTAEQAYSACFGHWSLFRAADVIGKMLQCRVWVGIAPED